MNLLLIDCHLKGISITGIVAITAMDGYIEKRSIILIIDLLFITYYECDYWRMESQIEAILHKSKCFESGNCYNFCWKTRIFLTTDVANNSEDISGHLMPYLHVFKRCLSYAKYLPNICHSYSSIHLSSVLM